MLFMTCCFICNIKTQPYTRTSNWLCDKGFMIFGFATHRSSAVPCSQRLRDLLLYKQHLNHNIQTKLIWIRVDDEPRTFLPLSHALHDLLLHLQHYNPTVHSHLKLAL
jgi:hypothetical protein